MKTIKCDVCGEDKETDLCVVAQDGYGICKACSPTHAARTITALRMAQWQNEKALALQHQKIQAQDAKLQHQKIQAQDAKLQRVAEELAAVVNRCLAPTQGGGA